MVEEPNGFGLLHAGTADRPGRVGGAPAALDAVVEDLAEQGDRVVDEFGTSAAAAHRRDHSLDIGRSDSPQVAIGEMAGQMGVRQRPVCGDRRRLKAVCLEVIDQPLGGLGYRRSLTDWCRARCVQPSTQLTLGLRLGETITAAGIADGTEFALDPASTCPLLAVPIASFGEKGTAAVGAPRSHSLSA